MPSGLLESAGLGPDFLAGSYSGTPAPTLVVWNTLSVISAIEPMERERRRALETMRTREGPGGRTTGLGSDAILWLN